MKSRKLNTWHLCSHILSTILSAILLVSFALFVMNYYFGVPDFSNVEVVRLGGG